MWRVDHRAASLHVRALLDGVQCVPGEVPLRFCIDVGTTTVPRAIQPTVPFATIATIATIAAAAAVTSFAATIATVAVTVTSNVRSVAAAHVTCENEAPLEPLHLLALALRSLQLRQSPVTDDSSGVTVARRCTMHRRTSHHLETVARVAPHRALRSKLTDEAVPLLATEATSVHVLLHGVGPPLRQQHGGQRRDQTACHRDQATWYRDETTELALSVPHAHSTHLQLSGLSTPHNHKILCTRARKRLANVAVVGPPLESPVDPPGPLTLPEPHATLAHPAAEVVPRDQQALADRTANAQNARRHANKYTV